MKSVNLLPPKHRPRTPTGGGNGSAYIVLGVLGAAVVAVLMYVVTANSINDSKSAIAEAKAETARANAQTQQLGAYGDFAKVKEQRVTAIKGLAQGRADWERMARELSVVLPDGVWINTVNASDGTNPQAAVSGAATSGSPVGGGDPAAGGNSAGGGTTLTVDGCADSQSKVAVTLVRLRQMEGAQDVALESSTRPDQAQEPCGDNWEFTATVSFAAQDGGGEKAPDRLGGGA